MDVYQLSEDDEPTIEAIRLLIELRETNNAAIACSKVRFASNGLELANEYECESLQEFFADALEDALEYVDEQFVGAKYSHREAKQELLILDVEDLGMSQSGVELIALFQWASGELGEETAHAIAADDGIELKQSGQSRNPLATACAERNHKFDMDVLQQAPGFAKCSECYLSRNAVQHHLKQDVPKVCDACDSIAYEFVY
ncbi:hypothetical protein [Natronorubrum tibetense]|uniref:Uncharacterized protein n=1 Tax=Natronorubrum tibetense GA33 TaxID=1114856 RepID=L9VKG0_9EURY|nr:hypothetical protein [Natronorubrum tibetense]ELY37700.1 hypothetical protein C496_19370 [Natronorubrum tibetense GA33]